MTEKLISKQSMDTTVSRVSEESETNKLNVHILYRSNDDADILFNAYTHIGGTDLQPLKHPRT